MLKISNMLTKSICINMKQLLRVGREPGSSPRRPTLHMNTRSKSVRLHDDSRG